MPSPHNLKVEYSCSECRVRTDRLFCNMSAGALEALDSVKFTGLHPKGSLLFTEGEEPRGVFIVCSGRVRLTTTSPEGKTLIVKIAEPGEVLGTSATIVGKPYEVSAETIEPAQLNFIKRNDFLEYLNTHAEAALHTAQLLCEKHHSS
ncbi:MAG TPA: cyclic nucleotide-binding domain-containing protein [Thermoanaerobaculia bacterium]